MNKRLLAGACSLAAAGLILAGCGADAPEPMRFAWSNPTSVTITETAPNAAAEGERPRFGFGDIAWSLREDSEGLMRLSRHAVVAQAGDFLVVTTAVTDSPEALEEYLRDMEQYYPGECLTLMLAGDCYSTEAEAQAAADGLQEG